MTDEPDVPLFDAAGHEVVPSDTGAVWIHVVPLIPCPVVVHMIGTDKKPYLDGVEDCDLPFIKRYREIVHEKPEDVP